MPRRYKATETKYKGRADEKYVTYDLEQATRGGGTAKYPKVKRVYIGGDVQDWEVGDFRKRTGRKVHGVKIGYEQERAGFTRRPFTAHRGETEYSVGKTTVEPVTQHFTKIVEVPDEAENVKFREELPMRYQDALQDIR